MLAVAWDEDMAGSGQTPEAAAEFRRLDLQAIDLNGLPLNDLVSRLGRLPDHAVVLLGVSSGQLDSAHWMNPAWPLCEVASRAANRPTFMLGAHFLGCGVVGGLLRDFSAIGRIVGERALSALAGRQAPNEVIPLRGIHRAGIRRATTRALADRRGALAGGQRGQVPSTELVARLSDSRSLARPERSAC